MSKILSIAYHHKAQFTKGCLKIGVTAFASLIGQTALAVCPDPFTIANFESKIVGKTDAGLNIYFCNQVFSNPALTFAPSEDALVSGGSQTISKGGTNLTTPLVSSVNLTGFNISDWAFGTLSANFPNINGIGTPPSPSLFNFYTKRNSTQDCSQQYPQILNFLRNKPSVFQITDPPSAPLPTTDTSNNNIAKITGAKLKSEIDSTKEIIADIELYHANANLGGQYFTRPGLSGTVRDRYCWFGVGAKMKIKPNGDSLKYSGNYGLKIGVEILP